MVFCNFVDICMCYLKQLDPHSLGHCVTMNSSLGKKLTVLNERWLALFQKGYYFRCSFKRWTQWLSRILCPLPDIYPDGPWVQRCARHANRRKERDREQPCYGAGGAQTSTQQRRRQEFKLSLYFQNLISVCLHFLFVIQEMDAMTLQDSVPATLHT